MKHNGMSQTLHAINIEEGILGNEIHGAFDALEQGASPAVMDECLRGIIKQANRVVLLATAELGSNLKGT